ncbi:hypothetical protein GCM10010329_69660 [Streptomyces spiroverticillatus]|uniref:Cobyrinic acid a,c-diamide synthase n=1 Tax=Streptomyces finlayi TaxID=67296 RepID=A0A918X0V2_9ACTN|nr:hypothetical protein [Streptomyces finlayi]GHA36571.1 hypothetical protein GCM10010329_69660 [Streptomyces spiroverticillatus]GHD01926.1 hypothetical protein GCM10010334_48130 [Streptomyces finlayi]
MSRRVSLPGADELFRTTGGMGLQAAGRRSGANGEPRIPAPAGESEPAPVESGEGPEHGVAADAAGQQRTRGAEAAPPPAAPQPPANRPQEAPGAPRGAAPGSTGAQPRRRGGRGANRRPSGRERHDEKITVYVSAEELMDLEHARLVLRGEHGLAVDRGRIVREAVAVVLADLESRGDASILVRRLRGR